MADEKLIEIYVDNPITTLANGDLFYTSVNNDTVSEDGAISYSDLLANVQADLPSGSNFWTLVVGSPVRTSNTTFTVTGNYSSSQPFGKGIVFQWEESGVKKCGIQSIPQTYSSPNTTFTIIGDTMTSIDTDTLKYFHVGAEAFSWKFAYAGTIGATGTNIANTKYAEFPMIVLGADLQVGTAGTTNATTIDINKNGTTMFATKPTLATTVATSPTPFTANNGTSLALADKVTIDVDAVQTTPAVDLYATLYLFPTRYLYLS